MLRPRVTTRTILVYSGIFTFLVDAYPTYSASALAANSFMRSSFGGIFPLFGIQSEFAHHHHPRPRPRPLLLQALSSIFVLDWDYGSVLCMCRLKSIVSPANRFQLSILERMYLRGSSVDLT